MADLWRNLNALLLLALSIRISDSACPVPPNASQRRVLVDGAEPAGGSYDPGASLSVSCPEGHRLNGSISSITCTQTPTKDMWTPYWPKCLLVKCLDLDVPNGRVSTQRVRVGARVTVSCSPGFVLSVNSAVTGPLLCQNNGSWNQTTPSCVPGCPRPHPRQKVHLHETYRLRESFQLGSSISYRCSVGYVRAGGSSISQCSQTGWTIPTLRCERKSCGSVGELRNGRNIYEGVRFGHRVTAVCNEGFFLIGGDTRVCTSSGWSGQEPVCEPVQCPAPPHVAGSEMWGSLDEPYLYSQVISYRCRHGYLLGAKEIHCTENGTWSAPPPTCTDKTCRQPVMRFGSRTWNYKLNYRPGEQVGVACDQGTRLVGAARLTCGIDGQWSPPVPRCEWISK